MNAPLSVIVPLPLSNDKCAETPCTLDPAHIEGPVYLAHPLHIHQAPRARRFINLARRRFPNADILPACDQFSSNADWLRRWPQILPTLAAVCVFADTDGWVGKGVWDEVCDAMSHGIPVFVLTNKRLHPRSEVALIESDCRDWQHYARLHFVMPAWGRHA